jgi:hypothetical protein
VDLIRDVTGTRALGTLPSLPEPDRSNPDRLARALHESLGAAAVARLLGR